MAPVGEESRSETAQQTLAGSQAAPSSPRSPTPTRTESCTAKAGRRARAQPELPPEDLSLLLQILFRSVLPSPEEEGAGNRKSGKSKGLHLSLLPPVGEELELGPAELLQRDVVLAGLRGCRVRLRGNANTLRVRDCRGCTVLCGPVSTSALVDGCSDCLLVLACQQLRTHRTRDSRFYVQVTSRAVIEDCATVSFAPYTWSYPGIERDFESSGLDRNTNNWNLVDDFDWLATDKPSPNWSLIPEQERISCWD
ncbi:PREDICTED: tubulin-specific chaperone C [Haliaeetus leucocephalus]|uniref:tubulin-specific chaperone C n=1 Tax=Haliaeetus leucocephalus TaxID=52644 RepID=UPI00053CB1AA|nr:PREDICTED: tubulin-specific chaperone C [Haliaeetus leucocephalus]